MRSSEEKQTVARSPGVRFEAPGSDEGALEIVERMTDVLGERATAAVLRYAAEALVLQRLEAARLEKGQHAYALHVASRVSRAALRVLVETEQGFEVEAAPGPALEGLRRALVDALCQGAAEGAFKAAFHAQAVRSQVEAEPDGRLRVSVRRA